jgi:hypothetical protein
VTKQSRNLAIVHGEIQTINSRLVAKDFFEVMNFNALALFGLTL